MSDRKKSKSTGRSRHRQHAKSCPSRAAIHCTSHVTLGSSPKNDDGGTLTSTAGKNTARSARVYEKKIRQCYAIASGVREKTDAVRNKREPTQSNQSDAAITTSRLVGGLAAGLLAGYLGFAHTAEKSTVLPAERGMVSQRERRTPLDEIWLPPRVAREEEIWRDHTSA
ncbi:hypothetical protein GF342_00920 [Candidatus Woesearchaeota archaeon]|nr:hypothetical protein [Candidatus Woesearchaeota archaeon]